MKPTSMLVRFIAAALWCGPVLASVRLEPNRSRIHLGTGISSPRTASVVLGAFRTLNYAEPECTPAHFSVHSLVI